ncbi:MAG: dipeptidase [Deltaproteobacteria bacterium]|nr:dipeptidase [Deltaproteobacteria bacterium]
MIEGTIIKKSNRVIKTGKSVYTYSVISSIIFLLSNPNLVADNIPIALTHIDTISVYCGKIDSRDVEVDFLRADGPLILLTAIWIPRYISGASESFNYTKQLKRCLDEKIIGNKDIILVNSKRDILEAIAKKKIAVILALEGGEPLEDINNIEQIKKIGIKSVSLTWSRDNSLACAHNTKNDLGLSNKGREVVKLLNDNKIMIDVSHLSDKTIEDIINMSRTPIYASHSNARAICNSNRNLTDTQIKRIASKGGIIGLSFHSTHLSCNKESSVEDIYKHIAHIRKIAGVEAIAIGSDFDGHIKTPSDIKGLKDISVLIQKLKLENWTDTEIEFILYKNFVRFFEKVNDE